MEVKGFEVEGVIKVDNVRVYGLNESVIASGYPMQIKTNDMNKVVIGDKDLKRVKHASKLYKSLNNKLQYWSYRQVLDKLEALSELEGFKLIKVDPAYTSQTCSNCGTILKNNRQR